MADDAKDRRGRGLGCVEQSGLPSDVPAGTAAKESEIKRLLVEAQGWDREAAAVPVSGKRWQKTRWEHQRRAAALRAQAHKLKKETA